MEVTRALATGRRLLREHGLDDWTIVADRAKTRAGVCRFAQRQIGLSAPLTALHSDADVLDTILHEIAHALVGPQHGHDAVWRAKARAIGCTRRAVRVLRRSTGARRLGRPLPGGAREVPAPCADPPDVVWRVLPALRPASPVHLDLPRAPGQPAQHVCRAARRAGRTRRPAEQLSRTPLVGDLVEVAGGPWQGLVGEVELVGAVRCQVRVDDDELVSVPLEAVRVLPASAARRSRSLL